MSELIEPRTLKGFRDFLPAAMIPRERLIETAKRVVTTRKMRSPNEAESSTRTSWPAPMSTS